MEWKDSKRGSWGLRTRVCLALGVTAEWLEGGEKGSRWDVGREAFFHTVSGKGEVAKGIIVLGKGADPDVRLRLLHDRMQMQGTGRRGRALGPRGVKPWPGTWMGLPSVLGRPAAASGSTGSCLWAAGSAAASALGGSRLPRSCGARAARGRERRGKQQAGRAGAGGSGSEGRGSAAWGTRSPLGP